MAGKRSKGGDTAPFIPTLIEVDIFGTMPLHEPQTLGRMLDVLEASSKFAPEFWSTDERKQYLFSRSDILDLFREKASIYHGVYLWRKKTPKYFACLDPGRWPYISWSIDKKLSRKHWPDLLSFVGNLCSVIKPDVCNVRIMPPYPDPPWVGDDNTDLVLMAYSSSLAPVNYYKEGICGLATRTYFGPHYIRQFGRNTLESIPGAQITDTDWGGLQIDLFDDITQLTSQDLLTRWKSAMAHLRPGQVLADVEVTSDQDVLFTKGRNCEVGGEIPEDKF